MVVGWWHGEADPQRRGDPPQKVSRHSHSGSRYIHRLLRPRKPFLMVAQIRFLQLSTHCAWRHAPRPVQGRQARGGRPAGTRRGCWHAICAPENANVGTHLTRFAAPYRCQPTAPVAAAACRHPAISAHHSRVSLPHGELNRKPSGSGRMPSPHHFGTLLTRFADPWRAPPKAPQWPRSLGGSTEGTSGCGELHHRTPVATVAWRHLMSSTHSNEEYI